MRLVLNILILVTAVTLLAGVMWQHGERSAEQSKIEQTRDEVARFHRVIALHAALNNIERSSRGYPMTVDPLWFNEGEVPVNPLLNPSHPWLEIAHPGHGDLLHPPVRAASERSHARFWYNPTLGVVRARVPRGASDAATLRLYNAVNGTNLATLFPDPQSFTRVPAEQPTASTDADDDDEHDSDGHVDHD
jgi:hypothetical protein